MADTFDSSESFDDLGSVGEDSRWDVFYDVSSKAPDKAIHYCSLIGGNGL